MTAFFSGGGKVDASSITNYFPRSLNNGSQELYTALSNYDPSPTNPGSHLESPQSTIRFFYFFDGPGGYPQSNLIDVNNGNSVDPAQNVVVQIFFAGCTPGSSGFSIINGGNSGNRRNFTSANCGGNQTRTIPKSQLRSDPRYPSNVRYFDLYLQVNNGLNNVRLYTVSLTPGYVTQKEVDTTLLNNPLLGDSDNYNGFSGVGTQKGPYAQLTTKLNGDSIDYNWKGASPSALIAGPNAQQYSGYDFQFKTDCESPANQAVYLRWFDADNGPNARNQYIRNDPVMNKQMGFVYSSPTYTSVVVKDAMGDNDQYRQTQVNFKRGDKSTWAWSDVSKGNGVQMWLPFSEFTLLDQFKCDQKPVGEITEVKCTYIKGWAVDPDKTGNKVDVRLQYKTTNGNWNNFNPVPSGNGLATKYYGISETKGYPPGHDFMVKPVNLSQLLENSPTREFRLTIVNIDQDGNPDSSNDVTTSRTFTVNGCTGTNGCEQSVRILSPNSTYRFTVMRGNKNHNNFGGPTTPTVGAFTPTQSNPGFTTGNYWKSIPSADHTLQTPINTAYNSTYRNYTDEAKTVTIDYPDPTYKDRIMVVEKWSRKSGGPGWEYQVSTESTANLGLQCFVATCTMQIVNTIGGVGVEAGKPFTVRTTVTNTGDGDLPYTTWGGFGQLSLTTQSGSGWHLTHKWLQDLDKSDTRLDRGETTQILEFALDAPDTVQRYNLSMYPDYYNIFGLGPSCNSGAGVNVDTFKRFEITPTATVELVPDDESPNQANFNFSAKNSGWLIQANTVRTLTKNGTLLVPTQSTPETIGDFSGTMSGPTNTPTLGDEYCGKIVVSPAKGWAGPFQQTIPDADGGSAEKEDCQRVANKPYVRAYGADVTAGGGFGTSCSDNNAFIKTYTRPIGDLGTKSGSGVQLAAMALGAISGFPSAALRTQPPEQPRGLTFANTEPPTVSDAGYGPLLGGNMSGDGWCKPDYYRETQYPDNSKKSDNVTNWKTIINTNGGSVDLNNQLIADEGQSKINPGTTGSVMLNGMSGYGKRHTMYVEGDVFIASNITYKDQYNATNEIPNFTLVVKGNIYIANSVTTLDGLYIAQPNDAGKKGIIYTCATGVGVAPNSSQLFSDCGAEGNDKQLRVNGAFIAQRVVLNRTGHTLRDSAARELANDSKAAEIFNFSPEVYLSPPVFNPRSTLTSGEFKYITTLPPIL